MQPTQKSTKEAQQLTVQKPLIPSVTLDPFSTAAIFTLYNAMYEKDRIGIADNAVFHQPYDEERTYILPIVGEVNTQKLSRNWYVNSRDDACDFAIAIIESIFAYLKYDSYKKMLPELKKGVIRYMNSYGKVTDNATTTFQLILDRVQEAIEWDGKGVFQTKLEQKLPPELNQKQDKYYNYWSEAEVNHVVSGIFLGIYKFSSTIPCEAELESTKKYLEIKQKEINPVLTEKYKMLHNTK